MKMPEKEKSEELILPWLPDQFESLNKEEDGIRTNSILQINAEPDLKSHVEIIQASLNMLFHLSIDYVNQTDDEQTIQFLGIRLFNTVVISFKLLLSGYYQGSAFIQRDLLETGFLLDYFSYDPSKISEWRNSDDKDRYEKFRPAAIRQVLDIRDGANQEKRGKMYKLLCNAAAHPTYMGFQLLAPNGNVTLGPFYNERFLKASLVELVKRLPLFTIIIMQLFNSLPVELLKLRAQYVLNAKQWMEKYFGFNVSHIDTNDIEQFVKLF